MKTSEPTVMPKLVPAVQRHLAIAVRACSQAAMRLWLWAKMRMNGGSVDASSELVELTAIATAATFLAGWQYSRAYYEAFAIRPGLLDFQVSTHFVWALRPMLEHVLGTVVIVAAVFTLAHVRRRANGALQYLASLAFLIVLLWVFSVVSSTATDVGSSDALASRRDPQKHFPLVVLYLKDRETAQRADANLLRYGVGVVHGGEYRLVGLHRGLYYFLSPDLNASHGPLVVSSDAVMSITYRR